MTSPVRAARRPCLAVYFDSYARAVPARACRVARGMRARAGLSASPQIREGFYVQDPEEDAILGEGLRVPRPRPEDGQEGARRPVPHGAHRRDRRARPVHLRQLEPGGGLDRVHLHGRRQDHRVPDRSAAPPRSRASASPSSAAASAWPSPTPWLAPCASRARRSPSSWARAPRTC